jgi:CubicO group peptidase (beta-lactamase class C family)
VIAPRLLAVVLSAVLVGCTGAAQGNLVADALADIDPDGPGCVAGARTPDGQQLATAGLADVEDGAAITEDTIFDIASVSKQMTAGAIALLVVEGDLSLDTPVDELLDLPLDTAEVTVGDLLHHTSGLPDYTGLLDAGDDEVTTNDDAVTSLEGQELAFDPGTDFEYSNTNYQLLGQVVGEVTGADLVAFSAEELFGPLGMDDTVVRDDQGDLLPGQAQGYEAAGDGWTAVGSSWQQTGDGAVHSTVPDLLRWAELFLDGPTEEGLGSSAWVEVMTTPGPVLDDGVGYGGGLGIDEVDDGLLLAHAGSWIGVASSLQMLPDAGLAVAVLCNGDDIDADGMASELLDTLAADA